MYKYKAILNEMFEDGSLEIDIDLGFNIIYRVKMYRLVTMEKASEELVEYEQKLLKSKLLNSNLHVGTVKKSYGEDCWVATIHSADGILPDWLMTNGFIISKEKKW